MINTSSRGLVFLAPTIFVLCQINGISIGLRIFGGSIREQYDGLSPPVKFLFEQTNFKSDIIFVETKASVEYLKKKLGDDAKIQWFPNVRKPFARAKVKKKYNKRFVFISHVKKSKGVGEIIEVATKLPDGYIVDIFGPVVDEWLVEKIADLNNVRYCGVVEPGMVQDLLIKYDVLLLPTYYKGEGYPGIILEALSVGMPVITTNWKSIPEIITNKYDGILISIKNSEELKEAIVGFDSSTLIEYRKNALSSFEQYNENIVYENIINMLNEV